MCSDVIDAEDVGMIECAGSLRFLFEAIEPTGILGKRRRQNFDRYVASEFRIARAINDTHAAFADLRDNCVLGDCGVGGDGHCRISIIEFRCFLVV
jgi:hypothetical protein